MSNADEYWNTLRNELLTRIDSSQRRKLRVNITTLMGWFGSTATRRIRQDYFLWVLEVLTEWGITYQYTGTTARDTITLSRTAPAPQLAPLPDAETFSDRPPALALDDAAPLPFLFYVDGVRDTQRVRHLMRDIQSAIWAFHPVCLFVEAGDEFFAFACGFFAALLRRRALMTRAGDWPLAPELITVDYLKQALGRSPSPTISPPLFPLTGCVYILRQNLDDLEDDELIAATRECILPHTYNLTAKFVATSGDRQQGPLAAEASGFHLVFQWIAAFAGTLRVPMPAPEQPLDLSRLLTEAVQAHDALLERQTLQPVDAAFRAGFESTEHMVLKSLLLNGLRQHYPDENIAIEELLPPRDENLADEELFIDRPRRDKPDLRIGQRLWIEVETLRGLSRQGSNPFFALETKLRQKLGNMRTMQEVWLMVPSDVAVLAYDQLGTLTQHLNATLEADIVRWGFVDMLTGTPVFLTSTPPPPQESIRLAGISLRRETAEVTSPLTWDDVAGYANVRARLEGDILDPLLNPERYQAYGLVAANGVLLYGLPGCGKSLIGRVLASVAGFTCRYVLPSDLSSMWLRESVSKTRELFDWALKQTPCLLILDELDAIAPQRMEHNMHTDEKRQVNELLAQLDRVSGKNVIVVATTNYLRGIDSAILRSGRFDVKLPVFPPNDADRQAIFDYYLSAPRLQGFTQIDTIDTTYLSARTPLFVAADIKTVVQTAARRSIRLTATNEQPRLTTEDLLLVLEQHPRTLQRDMAQTWIDEAAADLGGTERQVVWLREEIARAFG